MAKIPKPRKPGQTGNWAGHGSNAQVFNNRQKAGKGSGCVLFLIGAVVVVGGILAGIAELA